MKKLPLAASGALRSVSMWRDPTNRERLVGCSLFGVLIHGKRFAGLRSDPARFSSFEMFVPMVRAKTGRQPAKRRHRGEAMAAKTIREQRMLDALATRFLLCCAGRKCVRASAAGAYFDASAGFKPLCSILAETRTQHSDCVCDVDMGHACT